MSRIRVNTEDLKNKAKDFDSASEAIKRAGDDILAAAMAMPSYDGQLSGPARKMGYEFQKKARELSTALAGDADSLRKSAKAFEDVDNQTIHIFEENTILLSAAFIPGGPRGEDDGPIRKGGNPDLLCYYDYGESVIFYNFGDSIIINITDENRAMVEKYINAVDEFCKNFAEMVNIFIDMMTLYLSVQQIAAILLVYVSLAIISAPLAAAIAKELGLSAAWTTLAVDGTAQLISDINNLSPYEIFERLGLLLDPINPKRYLEELKELNRCGLATSQAYDDAQQAWYSLAPSTSSEPSVPIPTPPTQTPTPTETPPPPTPTETPPPPVITS